MTELDQIRAQRANLHDEASKLITAAHTELRGLTAEEEQRFDRLMDEIDRLGGVIERTERLSQYTRDLDRPLNDPIRPNPGGGSGDPQARTRQFRDWLRGEGGGRFNFRALQMDSDVGGGYLAAEEFVADLIKAVDNEVFIRRRATIIPVADAESLGVPTLEADPDDADWTIELGTGSEDSSMAFGKRELHPQPMAKRILVSKRLLRSPRVNADGLVRDRFAYKSGVTQEKAFLTGTGVKQPLGVFTASTDGIPTTRDVSTGNTTTAVTYAGLVNALYSLKSQYQRNAAWMFHRDAIKQIRLIVDGNNLPIWQVGLQGGQPDSILALPFDQSEYVPNTFTTGQYVGIVGDWSNYWIAESLAYEIQRLVELKAETNQDEFIMRAELDGQPVLSEAFARVKLA